MCVMFCVFVWVSCIVLRVVFWCSLWLISCSLVISLAWVRVLSSSTLTSCVISASRVIRLVLVGVLALVVGGVLSPPFCGEFAEVVVSTGGGIVVVRVGCV